MPAEVRGRRGGRLIEITAWTLHVENYYRKKTKRAWPAPLRTLTGTFEGKLISSWDRVSRASVTAVMIRLPGFHGPAFVDVWSCDGKITGTWSAAGNWSVGQ